jgi:hypothetical protein
MATFIAWVNIIPPKLIGKGSWAGEVFVQRKLSAIQNFSIITIVTKFNLHLLVILSNSQFFTVAH